MRRHFPFHLSVQTLQRRGWPTMADWEEHVRTCLPVCSCRCKVCKPGSGCAERFYAMAAEDMGR